MTTDKPLQLVPCKYKGKGQFGDFEYMLAQPSSHTAICLFSDNVVDQWSGEFAPGGGSASVRPMAKPIPETGMVYAFGIPTGWSVQSKGFTLLDEFVKMAIDVAFDKAVVTIRKQRELRDLHTIYYPCSENDDSVLGTGIFANTLSSTVLDHICQKMRTLVDDVMSGKVIPPTQMRTRWAFKMAKYEQSNAILISRVKTLSGQGQGFDRGIRQGNLRDFVMLPAPKRAKTNALDSPESSNIEENNEDTKDAVVG